MPHIGFSGKDKEHCFSAVALLQRRSAASAP
jgi:hypothetical protein